MKSSEARILIYIENAAGQFCYAALISSKLDIDYAYVIQILKKMEYKKWLKASRDFRRVYYSTTATTPTTEAIERLKANQTQLRQKDND